MGNEYVMPSGLHISLVRVAVECPEFSRYFQPIKRAIEEGRPPHDVCAVVDEAFAQMINNGFLTRDHFRSSTYQALGLIKMDYQLHYRS